MYVLIELDPRKHLIAHVMELHMILKFFDPLQKYFPTQYLSQSKPSRYISFGEAMHRELHICSHQSLCIM